MGAPQKAEQPVVGSISTPAADDDVKFDGVPVKLGRKTFIVPPIAFRKLRAMMPRLVAIKVDENGRPDADSVDIMLDAALAALQRNYPEITAAELDELVDLANVIPLLNAVMAAAGLEKVDAGKDQPG